VDIPRPLYPSPPYRHLVGWPGSPILAREMGETRVDVAHEGRWGGELVELGGDALGGRGRREVDPADPLFTDSAADTTRGRPTSASDLASCLGGRE